MISLMLPKKTGILVSGGADSALLLYFVLKEKKFKEKVHIFTITNSIKNCTNAIAALKVVNFCCSFLDNRNVEHHFFHRTSQADNDFKDIKDLYIKKNIIDKMVIGISATPPINSEMTLYDPEYDNIEQLTTNETRDPLIYKDPFPVASDYCMPFINLNKQEIANLYKQFNLLDNLFPLTRSCENMENIIDKHCGKCWWCRERFWGFNRLD